MKRRPIFSSKTRMVWFLVAETGFVLSFAAFWQGQMTEGWLLYAVAMTVQLALILSRGHRRSRGEGPQ